ncbi:hypothetical protein ACF0H5_002580 [Mactra antiquata]
MKILLAILISVLHVTCVHSGSHWIVLPDKYIPGNPMPLSFSFFNVSDDVVVQIDLIANDHLLVDSINHTFKQGRSEIIQLPVPSGDVYTGEYLLLINGFSGVYFQDHARVKYDSGHMPDTFAVHIQTDKGIYKPGQTVHFRTFGISSDMMVYTGTFNVSIRDPKGNLMKKMVNVSESEYGVVEDFLIMDTEPVLGDWGIQVEAREPSMLYPSIKTKFFKVDKYVLPKFEVKVELPPFVVTTDKEMYGTVKAKYTYGKPVIGTVRLYADIDYSQAPWKYTGTEVMVEASFDINGEAKFTVPFSRITNEVDPYSFQPLVEKLAGYHLTIKASVTESLNNITRNATQQVIFYNQPYKLSFDRSASMPYFKPGLPFIGYVSLTQANGNPIISSNEEVRLVSYVKFYDKQLYKYRAQYLTEQTFAPPPNGVLEVVVDPPVNVSSLHLEVFYNGLTDTLNIDKPSWLLDTGNIQISQNTSTTVGKDAVFNVRRSLGMVDATLFYAIIANDRVVQAGTIHDSTSDIVQISFSVTSNMKPYAKLVVYFFETSMWNADAIFFDVHEDSNKFKNKISISFDQTTAEPGENISLSISTDPMSLVNLLAVDQSVLLLASGNDITKKEVISSLQFGSHAGQDSSSLHDPKTVLKSSGIQLLTDVKGFDWGHPHYKRQIDCNPGSGAMIGAGTSTVPPMPTMPLQQVTHTRDSFPETWLWTNLTVGSNGTASLTTTVPDTITSWFATAFSVNKLSGLGLTDSSVKFTTFRPFFINLNLPYSVVRGEEVVLQANVFNYMGQDLDVVVTFEKSNDYQVINRDQTSGHVTYSSVDVVQNIHIKAGMAESVFVPVVAKIVGVTKIAVKAQTALSADRVIRNLIIEAEGTPMHFNVPMILNKNTGVDVPLSFPPTFVVDSQKIQVSIIGDTMGPTVKNLKGLLRMPTGCGEQTMISLAPDVFVYNYLKATNKLTPEIADMALQYMYKGYQRELTFQRNDGSFSIWGQSDSTGSMWLSAFVLKSFHQAKAHIYIEDNIIFRIARWMLSYQDNDGSFRAIGTVHSTSLKGGASSGDSLTAFVLISLLESEVTLKQDGYYANRYTSAIANAVSYLEQRVVADKITDMYDLAVVTYALGLSGSSQGYPAYRKLDKMAITTSGGKKYWNATTTPNLYSWEYSYYQSPPLEIEIASYALLYLTKIHQYSDGFPILQWLIGQRNSRGAFRSTQDTVLGLQAMSEYGSLYNAPNGPNLFVGVASGNFLKQVHVGPNDAMVLKLVDIPLVSSNQGRGNNSNTPSSVSLHAEGSGSVLVQVSVSFNVETEVALPAFNITTSIISETFRSIIVRACARYLPQRFETGSMSVMEIDIPSGFAADLESPDTNIQGTQRSEIRDEKTVVLYYDEILPRFPGVCATVEMIRTDLVAKTKPAAIRVFDYYKPDNRALAFFESQLLKQSSYCDICTDCGC